MRVLVNPSLTPGVFIPHVSCLVSIINESSLRPHTVKKKKILLNAVKKKKNGCCGCWKFTVNKAPVTMFLVLLDGILVPVYFAIYNCIFHISSDKVLIYQAS